MSDNNQKNFPKIIANDTDSSLLSYIYLTGDDSFVGGLLVKILYVHLFICKQYYILKMTCAKELDKC